jgi:hypothetical protein
MARETYEVDVNITAKGMRNRLSRPRESISESLRRSLQRYAVLPRERIEEHLFPNINKSVLQIMPIERNLIFIADWEELAD